jgi:hypothetical protein
VVPFVLRQNFLPHHVLGSSILVRARSRKRGTDPARRLPGTGAFGSFVIGRSRRWWTDGMLGADMGWGRRPVPVLILDARRAPQGQRQIAPPYPEAEAPADQLAGLRIEPAPAWQLDGVVHRRGDRSLARGASDKPGWPTLVFAAGHSDGTDAQDGVPARATPDGRVDRLDTRLFGLALPVPDQTPLSRRAATSDVPRPRAGISAEPVHLRVDSTGLKLCGAGEWLIEKHGTRTRRSWRKRHIGMDAATGEIVAAALTANDVDDASQTGALLDQVTKWTGL